MQVLQANHSLDWVSEYSNLGFPLMELLVFDAMHLFQRLKYVFTIQQTRATEMKVFLFVISVSCFLLTRRCHGLKCSDAGNCFFSSFKGVIGCKI